MNEQKVKKRGWIKNAAIIFLAVMLVLTFFSNTIMNRSLPEVSGQYVSSGSITARIRGTGTVTANESYDVILNETRTVSAVNVRLGDSVSTGDTLFTLGEAESQELTAAQEELNTLLLNYEKAVIQAGGGGESLEIRYAREELDAAQAELAKNVYSEQEIADAQAAVNNATVYRDSRQAAVDLAQAELDALGGPGSSDPGAIEAKRQQVNDAKKELDNKNVELKAAELLHKATYDAFMAEMKTELEKENIKIDSVEGKARILNEINRLKADSQNEESQKTVLAYETLNKLTEERDKLDNEWRQLNAELNALLSSDNSYQYNQLNKKLTEAKNALTAAETALSTAKGKLQSLQEKKDAWKAANDQVKACQKTLEGLLIQAQVTALDNAELQRQVQAKREQIAELEKNSAGGTVTSPVNGVVRQINVSAGNSTESGSPMAVIEVADRGYSISLPVTVEQSKKVSPGDAAEITGWWYGEELNVTLSHIRNDPENPSTSRLLVFDVRGQVESGTQLSLSIGQRSANYDLIVPNSALRSDANGDFVLVAAVKNSPLGNRYVATRVDVQVLATDDLNSAVSGALGTWDYVITTSTKPLEPGMLVRLVENI